jgi:hypothetical protein
MLAFDGPSYPHDEFSVNGATYTMGARYSRYDSSSTE